MKRTRWWVLLGGAMAGLMAATVGAVLGQQDGRLPAPWPPLPVLPGNQPLPAPAGLVQQVVKTEAAVEKQAFGSLSVEAPAGKQQPAVSVEWVGPTAIRIHQPMRCQLVVRNVSTAPAQNVIVRHRLAAGMDLKECEPLANNENGELVWQLGTLAPEQTRRIALTLIPHTRGPANCSAAVTFTALARHSIQVREPQLAIKMRASEKAVLGENIALLFSLTNPGDGVTEQIRVKVTLPDGLEHPRGKMVDFEVAPLAPKETRTVQLTCVARGTGPQKCAVSASADGNLSASDTALVNILTPKLEIALAGPKLRYLHRPALYVVKVSNPGSAPTTDVEVHETIPTGFRLHQANGGQYQEATRQISWKVGDLQPGQTKELPVELIPIEAGEHRLTAHARNSRGLKSEAEIRTHVEGLPSLEVEVTHVDDPIEVGAETAFEIRVANRGTKTESNVEVTCTLPKQLEFVGAKCTTTLHYRQEGRELIFETMPGLAPRAEEIFRVQVRGVGAGDVRFKTRIRADGLKDAVQREEGIRIYSDDGPQRAVIAPAPAPPGPAIPLPPGK